MFCRSCGKEIENDSKFCQYCGAEINTPKKTKTLNLIIISTIIIVLISITIFVAYVVIKNSSNKVVTDNSFNSISIADKNNTNREINNDKDEVYYNNLCNKCKYHPEEIEKDIINGADPEWWDNTICKNTCKITLNNKYLIGYKKIKESGLICNGYTLQELLKEDRKGWSEGKEAVYGDLLGILDKVRDSKSDIDEKYMLKVLNVFDSVAVYEVEVQPIVISDADYNKLSDGIKDIIFLINTRIRECG